MPLGTDEARAMSNPREWRREEGWGGREGGREREGKKEREREIKIEREMEREIQLHVNITCNKIAAPMTLAQKSIALLPRVIDHKRRITRLYLTDH